MGRLSLTEYAGRLYVQPGVEPLLLELQDEDGQDVLLLLVACWLGARGVRADAPLWQSLRERQTPWRDRVIEPLRQVRRALTGDAGAATLRSQVKDCELAAEWQQLARLQQCCEPLVPDEVPPEPAIQAHLLLYAGTEQQARLDALAALVISMEKNAAAGG